MDVARVWLYMSLMHGVEIFEVERQMFDNWSASYPASPWERERDNRISRYTRVINPLCCRDSQCERGLWLEVNATYALR